MGGVVSLSCVSIIYFGSLSTKPCGRKIEIKDRTIEPLFLGDIEVAIDEITQLSLRNNVQTHASTENTNQQWRTYERTPGYFPNHHVNKSALIRGAQRNKLILVVELER